AAAADPARWASIQDVADAAARPARTPSGLPRLVVVAGVPPPEQCGIPRPATAGDRPTLRLQLVSGTDAAAEDCPFSVYLYLSEAGVIEEVVVYEGGPGSSTTSTSNPSELTR
ncbi:MAG: hypothetical protein JWO76_899, partial [Nocardioides sp.]|nr:hypothetical protein [Nocardioides sp.]